MMSQQQPQQISQKALEKHQPQSTIVNNELDNAVAKVEAQLEVSHAQLQEMITDISRDRERNDLYGDRYEIQFNVEGVYQGETGILELMQDENYIEGKYQFNSKEFIGRLSGTLEGNIIKFSYFWTDGTKQGSGIFHVSSDEQSLDGYYFQSLDLSDLSMQDYEDRRIIWSFIKHGEKE